MTREWTEEELGQIQKRTEELKWLSAAPSKEEKILYEGVLKRIQFYSWCAAVGKFEDAELVLRRTFHNCERLLNRYAEEKQKAFVIHLGFLDMKENYWDCYVKHLRREEWIKKLESAEIDEIEELPEGPYTATQIQRIKTALKKLEKNVLSPQVEALHSAAAGQ